MSKNATNLCSNEHLRENPKEQKSNPRYNITLDKHTILMRSLCMTMQNNYDRITFSSPHDINIALNNLKDEIKTSKSDIIKSAIEHYLRLQEKLKLQKAIELMSNEYKNDNTLTG